MPLQTPPVKSATVVLRTFAPSCLFLEIPEREVRYLLAWARGQINLTVIRVFPMIHMEHPGAGSKTHIPATRAWRGACGAI